MRLESFDYNMAAFVSSLGIEVWFFLLEADSGGRKIQPDWIKVVILTTASKVHFKSDSPGAHARIHGHAHTHVRRETAARQRK